MWKGEITRACWLLPRGEAVPRKKGIGRAGERRPSRHAWKRIDGWEPKAPSPGSAKDATGIGHVASSLLGYHSTYSTRLGCAEQTGHVRALLLPPGRTRLPGPAQLFAAINASRSKRTASATQCTHHVAFCTSPPSGFFRFCRCCQLKEQLLRPKYPLL
jgi:hypothetical protein